MEMQPFYDKRDANYIALKSSSQFLEMCSKKNLKLDVQIPQTAIFEKGNPKLWIFNSKKEPNKVLKKNQDKLTTLLVARSFSRFKEDMRIDNVQALYEMSKQTRQFNDSTPIVFLRASGNQKRNLSCQDFLKLLMDGKDVGSFNYIQNYIMNSSKSNDVYYTEYRKDVDNLPVTFKHYKKTLTKKKPNHKHHVSDEPNPFKHLIAKDTKGKKLLPQLQTEELIHAYFKYFDAGMNQKFQEKATKVQEFIEGAFKVKVRKLICKFMVDVDNEVYFIGVKELLIVVSAQAPYDARRMNDELQQQQNRQFEAFMALVKMMSRKAKGNGQVFPRQIVENQKTMSQKLFKNLILERCQGDFCDYIMIERNKGPLQIRKGIQEKYKSGFQTSSSVDTMDNISTHLPYEISQQLILRARECSEDVIKLFLKNKIQLKTSEINDQANIDVDHEFPFRNKPRLVYNLENLYKKVKICKMCFILYSMVAKEFDLTLRKDLKIKSWASLPKLEDVIISDPKTQTLELIKETKADDDEASEEDHQQQKQVVLAPMRTQSEQKLRLKRRAYEKKPIKIFVVPKDLQEIHFIRASKTSQVNNRKAQQQMEVNRLALGFMNYQQLDSYKKNLADLGDSKSQPQKRHSFLEEQNQNLVAHLAQERTEPTRKLNQNTTENVHLIKLSEDLRNFAKSKKNFILKEISNDSDLRQLHQQYYLNQLESGGLLEHIFTNSYFYYHANFVHLRRIHKFRASTPLQPITDELKYDKLKQLTMEAVCSMMNYPTPQIVIPEIKYHVYDEKTAIPYALLQGRTTIPKSKNKHSNKSVQSGMEIIIFMHDMFESLYEYYDLMINHLKKFQNRKILMLNLPGQAYTIYSQFSSYTSLAFSEILDQLLYQLDEDQLIDLQHDTIKLVGIGSGGFVLQSFVCEAVGHIPYLSSITLINSFSKVDEQFSSLLNQAKKIISGHPKTMPELAYEYTSCLVNTKPLNTDQIMEMMNINPIQVNGRVTQIQSILNSPNMIDRFERVVIQVQVYHSLKNCLINIQEADFLSQFVQDEAGDINNPMANKKVALMKRSAEYIEGGHNVLIENPKFFNVILQRVFQ